MGDRRDPVETRPAPVIARSDRDRPTAAGEDGRRGSEGVIVHDAEGRIISATDRALELLGVTMNQLRAEVPRPPVWAFTAADGRVVDPTTIPPFAVATSGHAVPGGLFRVDSVPGGRRWLQVDSDAVRNDLGGVELIITTLHDATDERWTQLAYDGVIAITERAARDEPDDIDVLADDVLAAVGRASEAAWVICVRLDRAHGLARITNQWSRSGATWPHADRGAPIDMFARFMRHLARGRPVLMPDMRNLVDSAWVRERLDEWGLRSGATAPIMIGGRLDGFVALSWRRPMKAPREIADLIMLAGNTLASAQVTRRVEAEVDDLRRRLADHAAAHSRRAQLYDDVTPDLLLEIDEDDRLCALHLPDGFESSVLEQIEGHNVLDVFQGDQRTRLEEVLRAVRAGSPMEVFEFQWMEPTGSRSYESRFTMGPNGHIVNVVREVTARTDRERAVLEQSHNLAMANEELARLVHERDRFLASVSHELRTPLNAILGLAEMLLEGHDEPLTTGQSSTLRTIESSGRHLLELINDLLDLSRLRAEVVALDLRPVPLDEPCRLTFDLVRPRALALGVQVELHNPLDGLVIRADERRLRQVLINLMDNAVNFTEAGGTVGLDVTRPDEEHVALSVWDTGAGIAATDQSRIFEPFFQLGGRRDGRRMGSGLGLSVVERLVALHQGTITIDSAPGRGSRFTVVLPVNGPDPEG